MAKVKKEQEEIAKEKWQLAIEKLNKSYGIGTVISGDQKSYDIPAISTGCIALDHATGVWGLPKGRIVEIIAPESAGKTSMCLHVVANAQQQGIRCAYIDMEHTLSGAYAKSLNVNMEKLILSQPSWGEQALEIAHELIKTGDIGVVIVDSVAALVPKAERDGEIGDTSVSRMGRMMSQAMRMLSPVVEMNDCLLIFCNQIRANIGGMGNPEVPAGGNSLKFYASIRLDMRRIKNDKQEELSRTKIKVLKNKVGKPFQEVEVDLVWGEGFGKLGEIVDLAEELGIIVLSGSWYKWPDKVKKGDGESIAQGRNTMIELLKDNPEMKEQWEQKIISILKGEEIIEQAIPETIVAIKGQ